MECPGLPGRCSCPRHPPCPRRLLDRPGDGGGLPGGRAGHRGGELQRSSACVVEALGRGDRRPRPPAAALTTTVARPAARSATLVATTWNVPVLDRREVVTRGIDGSAAGLGDGPDHLGRLSGDGAAHLRLERQRAAGGDGGVLRRDGNSDWVRGDRDHRAGGVDCVGDAGGDDVEGPRRGRSGVSAGGIDGAAARFLNPDQLTAVD